MGGEKDMQLYPKVEMFPFIIIVADVPQAVGGGGLGSGGGGGATLVGVQEQPFHLPQPLLVAGGGGGGPRGRDADHSSGGTVGSKAGAEGASAGASSVDPFTPIASPAASDGVGYGGERGLLASVRPSSSLPLSTAAWAIYLLKSTVA